MRSINFFLAPSPDLIIEYAKNLFLNKPIRNICYDQL